MGSKPLVPGLETKKSPARARALYRRDSPSRCRLSRPHPLLLRLRFTLEEARHAPLQPGTRFVDKISRSRHIREVTLPRVQPIIPSWRREPFDNPDWLFDFKYDGFRGLCYLEQGRCRFISRNGNVLSRFEALADQVAAVLDVDEAVIDGEVIATDQTGRPQFYELLRVPRNACYVVFDILWADDTDLRSLPLDERRRRLQGILPKGSPIVSEALSVAGKGRELFQLMCPNDLEGVVAKRRVDPYDSRIRWLKIKNPDYSQKEGRGDLFNGPRQRTARTAG